MEFLEKLQGRKKTPESGVKLPVVTGPIIASIGPSESHAGSDVESFDPVGLEQVDYYEDPKWMSRRNQKNAGRESYVITDVGPSNKTSYGYRNCTGLAVVGVDTETGENISILTHQDPSSFLVRDELLFEEHLKDSLEKFALRVDKETIDAVLFGGNYFVDQRTNTGTGGTFADDYRSSVETLRRIVTDTIGMEPHVVIGPQTQGGDIKVTLDTKKRRLYMYRREQEKGGHTDVSFPASAVVEQDKRWREKYRPSA